MSEENNNLEDNIKKGAEEVSETAKEVIDDVTSGVKSVVNSEENKKMIAGLLAILLGGFGVHKFILGYQKEGIIQLVITFVTCGAGSIIGLIEGIIYLTKTDEEFYETYQANQKPWF